MNKKISTLVAAFLAAGYSYTVEAGIVKVASVTGGETYVIANTDGSKVLGHEGETLTAEEYASGMATQLWKYVPNGGAPQLQDPSNAAKGINVANTTDLTYGTLSTFTDGSINATSIKIDASNYLTMADPGTAVGANPTNVQFAKVTTLLSAAKDVPVVIGDQYLIIEGDGTVKTVDKAAYLKNSTVWTIKDGKISNGGKFVKLAEKASLVDDEAQASVFETDADGKLTVVATGFNKYVHKTSLALEDADANAGVLSTDSPYSYTESNTANIEAMVGFPAASRFVVYTNISGNTQTEYISTEDGTIKVGTGNAYPSSDFSAYYWTYNSSTGKITNQLGDVFTVGGYQEFILVQGMSGDKKVATFQLMTKDGKYVTYTSGVSGTFGIAASGGAIFSALETKTTGVSAGTLNKQVGNGFDLSIYTKKDGTTDVEGADIFTGVLTAEGVTPADNDKVYYLKNADGKYLALNNDKTVDGAVWGSSNNMNGNDGVGFKFTEVDKKDAEKVYTKFKIETADNGASQLVVNVMQDNGTTVFGRLFITKFNDKYYLTTKLTLDAGEAWPYIVYGSNNRVDIKTLLKGQFVNIAFANKQAKVDAEGKVLANEKYKRGGVLAIAREKITADPQAEYVPANNVLTTSPETQWAIQYVAEGNNSNATFVNRENPTIKVSGVVLYKTNVADVYAVTAVDANQNVVAKDTIRLSFVNHSMFDGFKYVDAAGLNDTIYNIAAYKAVNDVNNAYWVEKNHSTTHQIGLDGDVENAGNWNLRLATKTQDKKEVIDTVFVISEMSILKDGKVAEKKDTLAILPYVLQNAGNREFVKYGETKGVEYYVCDKDNKTRKNNAAKFALKVQPNGTYHIVTIGDLETATAITGKPAYTLGDKVFAGNAAKGGTLDNIANYTTTFNDLMVVEPVDAPEYRKVVKEWGDTIRIYRDDNSAQVLYEKLDPKSVVKGESFLNIDNVNQFDVNPALFVDTAYINRGNNTCWQYLLAVNVDKENSYYCPYNAEHNTDAWREANGGPCADAKEHRALKGRFLINLMDTANVYEATNQHENPYVNEIEAYEMKAKLAFVPGYHIADTLFITRANGDTVRLEMDTPDFNIAKFAFRYVDRDAKSFKIQTQVKNWKDGDLTKEDYDAPTANQGYLKWINGTVVVTEGFENGDVFNMNEDETRTPTENEGIDASKVAVIAGAGSVTIQNAAGKTVTISNILGKTIANTVISSDNATISVPAGITVVSVEGEDTVKAIVK